MEGHEPLTRRRVESGIARAPVGTASNRFRSDEARHALILSGSDGVAHVFMCKVRRLSPASPHAARPRIFLAVMLPPVPPRLVGTLSVLSWSAIRVKEMPSAHIAFMAQ